MRSNDLILVSNRRTLHHHSNKKHLTKEQIFSSIFPQTMVKLIPTWRYLNLLWCNPYSVSDNTTQKMKFSAKDFFSKCYQIRSFPANLTTLKKSLMENSFFCAVQWQSQSTIWHFKFKSGTLQISQLQGMPLSVLNRGTTRVFYWIN